MTSAHTETPRDSQRLDRWLWAARWFRSRSLAADAIGNGRVAVNGERAKPAKLVRTGDTLTIRRPPHVHEIEILELAPRRVSAKLATAFYRETETSIERREALAEQLALSAVMEGRRAGKLNKKDRREREHLKRQF